MTFFARGLRQLADGDHIRPRLDDFLDFQPDLPQIDVQVLEHIGRHPGAFLDEAQQNVLGPDVFVIETLGLLIGQLHDFACPVRESFVHSACLPL